MDCCGMPMAAWPGGGYVCRRCQAKVGVPWYRDRNPAARCVTEPSVDDMAPEPARGLVVAEDWASIEDVVVIEPAPTAPAMLNVEQPKSSGFGRGGRKGGPK